MFLLAPLRKTKKEGSNEKDKGSHDHNQRSLYEIPGQRKYNSA